MINVAFTPSELIILTHVLEHAADEFSNHGCNEIDITKIGLTQDGANEIRAAMARENIIDTETAQQTNRSNYLHNTLILRFLHKKLKDMIGLSVEEADRRIVAPLLSAGLVAKVSKTAPLRIVGGRSSETSGGFIMYEEAFAIWEDPNTRLYYAGKPKDNDNGDAHRTPEAAVKWIIDLYSGVLSPKPRRGRRSY